MPAQSPVLDGDDLIFAGTTGPGVCTGVDIYVYSGLVLSRVTGSSGCCYTLDLKNGTILWLDVSPPGSAAVWSKVWARSAGQVSVVSDPAAYCGQGKTDGESMVWRPTV